MAAPAGPPLSPPSLPARLAVVRADLSAAVGAAEDAFRPSTTTAGRRGASRATDAASPARLPPLGLSAAPAVPSLAATVVVAPVATRPLTHHEQRREAQLEHQRKRQQRRPPGPRDAAGGDALRFDDLESLPAEESAPFSLFEWLGEAAVVPGDLAGAGAVMGVNGPPIFPSAPSSPLAAASPSAAQSTRSLSPAPKPPSPSTAPTRGGRTRRASQTLGDLATATRRAVRLSVAVASVPVLEAGSLGAERHRPPQPTESEVLGDAMAHLSPAERLQRRLDAELRRVAALTAPLREAWEPITHELYTRPPRDDAADSVVRAALLGPDAAAVDTGEASPSTSAAEDAEARIRIGSVNAADFRDLRDDDAEGTEALAPGRERLGSASASVLSPPPSTSSAVVGVGAPFASPRQDGRSGAPGSASSTSSSAAHSSATASSTAQASPSCSPSCSCSCRRVGGMSWAEFARATWEAAQSVKGAWLLEFAQTLALLLSTFASPMFSDAKHVWGNIAGIVAVDFDYIIPAIPFPLSFAVLLTLALLVSGIVLASECFLSPPTSEDVRGRYESNANQGGSESGGGSGASVGPGSAFTRHGAGADATPSAEGRPGSPGRPESPSVASTSANVVGAWTPGGERVLAASSSAVGLSAPSAVGAGASAGAGAGTGARSRPAASPEAAVSILYGSKSAWLVPWLWRAVRIGVLLYLPITRVVLQTLSCTPEVGEVLVNTDEAPTVAATSVVAGEGGATVSNAASDAEQFPAGCVLQFPELQTSAGGPFDERWQCKCGESVSFLAGFAPVASLALLLFVVPTPLYLSFAIWNSAPSAGTLPHLPDDDEEGDEGEEGGGGSRSAAVDEEEMEEMEDEEEEELRVLEQGIRLDDGADDPQTKAAGGTGETTLGTDGRAVGAETVEDRRGGGRRGSDAGGVGGVGGGSASVTPTAAGDLLEAGGILRGEESATQSTAKPAGGGTVVGRPDAATMAALRAKRGRHAKRSPEERRLAALERRQRRRTQRRLLRVAAERRVEAAREQAYRVVLTSDPAQVVSPFRILYQEFGFAHRLVVGFWMFHTLLLAAFLAGLWSQPAAQATLVVLWLLARLAFVGRIALDRWRDYRPGLSTAPEDDLLQLAASATLVLVAFLGAITVPDGLGRESAVRALFATLVTILVSLYVAANVGLILVDAHPVARKWLQERTGGVRFSLFGTRLRRLRLEDVLQGPRFAHRAEHPPTHSPDPKTNDTPSGAGVDAKAEGERAADESASGTGADSQGTVVVLVVPPRSGNSVAISAASAAASAAASGSPLDSARSLPTSPEPQLLSMPPRSVLLSPPAPLPPTLPPLSVTELRVLASALDWSGAQNNLLTSDATATQAAHGLAWDLRREIPSRIWFSFWDSLLLRALGPAVRARWLALKRSVASVGLARARAHTTADEATLARRAWVEDNLEGIDVFWDGVLPDGSQPSNTCFGTLTVAPFPFHCLLAYDDCDAFVELWDEDLPALVTRNTDTAIVARRLVREQIRSLHGFEVEMALDRMEKHPVDDGDDTVEENGRTRTIQRKAKVATRVRYKRGTLRVRTKNERDFWSRGFGVSVLFQDGRGVARAPRTGREFELRDCVAEVGAEELGITFEFTMTPRLRTLLWDESNQSVVRDQILRLHERTEAMRRRRHEERARQQALLPERFITDVYYNMDADLEAVESFLDAVVDPSSPLLALRQEHANGLRFLFARVGIVTASPLATIWFLFWHDLWEVNRNLPGVAGHRDLFDHRRPSALAYHPRPRADLESILNAQGLYGRWALITPNILDRLYGWLASVAIATWIEGARE